MKSKKSLYWWIYVALAVIGFIDSAYLLWIKIANDKAYCLQGVGDCWTVNTSIYSQVFGIPISIFGMIGYAMVLVVFLLQNRNQFLKENSILVLFGLTLAGMLYSAYLTYIELFVLNAICPFCALSAIVMLMMFSMTVYRLVVGQAQT